MATFCCHIVAMTSYTTCYNCADTAAAAAAVANSNAACGAGVTSRGGGTARLSVGSVYG